MKNLCDWSLCSTFLITHHIRLSLQLPPKMITIIRFNQIIKSDQIRINANGCFSTFKERKNIIFVNKVTINHCHEENYCNMLLQWKLFRFTSHVSLSSRIKLGRNVGDIDHMTFKKRKKKLSHPLLAIFLFHLMLMFDENDKIACARIEFDREKWNVCNILCFGDKTRRTRWKKDGEVMERYHHHKRYCFT